MVMTYTKPARKNLALAQRMAFISVVSIVHNNGFWIITLVKVIVQNNKVVEVKLEMEWT